MSLLKQRRGRGVAGWPVGPCHERACTTQWQLRSPLALAVPSGLTAASLSSAPPLSSQHILGWESFKGGKRKAFLPSTSDYDPTITTSYMGPEMLFSYALSEATKRPFAMRVRRLAGRPVAAVEQCFAGAWAWAARGSVSPLVYGIAWWRGHRWCQPHSAPLHSLSPPGGHPLLPHNPGASLRFQAVQRLAGLQAGGQGGWCRSGAMQLSDAAKQAHGVVRWVGGWLGLLRPIMRSSRRQPCRPALMHACNPASCLQGYDTQYASTAQKDRPPLFPADFAATIVSPASYLSAYKVTFGAMAFPAMVGAAAVAAVVGGGGAAVAVGGEWVCGGGQQAGTQLGHAAAIG